MTPPNDALVRELRAFLQYVRDEDFLPEHGNLVARAIAALKPGPVARSEVVKHMVDRFLCWRLPENFNPDGGISFDPIMNRGHVWESKREPVGTNLFNRTQTTEMVRYMLEGSDARGPDSAFASAIHAATQTGIGAVYIGDAEALRKKSEDHAAPSPSPTAEDVAAKWLHGLFVQIEHGDEEHRRWLSSKLNDTVPSLAALIAASRRQPEWQDISTAPKDGTWVLIAGDSGYRYTPLRVAVARYDAAFRPHNTWQTHSDDAFTDGGSEPTHWMPLPTPPAHLAREQGL